MHSKAFSWLELFPVLRDWPEHIVLAGVIGVVLVLATAIARAQLMRVMSAADGGIIPEKKLTFRNFFEIIAELIYKMAESVLGPHDAATYFPVVGSLFVFIFASNIIGLVPGITPPTENLNTTLALGVFVFIFYNIAGIRANGLGYLKHFLGPVLWMAPLMVVIELVSHLARPLSLALRLRGNIMGDHIVLGVFNDLTKLVVPVVFYGMGVFVSFLQAFVFCLMTMVYISLSTAHDH